MTVFHFRGLGVKGWGLVSLSGGACYVVKVQIFYGVRGGSSNGVLQVGLVLGLSGGLGG